MEHASFDIYIVFADGDEARVDRLSEALEATKLRTFSSRDLLPGDFPDQALRAAMRQARAIVVLISMAWPEPADASDAWYEYEDVRNAIELVRRRGNSPPPRLIPILVEGAVERIPYGLSRVQAAYVTCEQFAETAREIAMALGVSDTVAADSTAAPSHTSADGPGEVVLEADALFADRYRLRHELGAGGVSTVWRAWDTHRQREVALKVLNPWLNHDRQQLARFEGGARHMASIEHDAVVEMVDGPVDHNQRHYYTMEYLSGGDLATARQRAIHPIGPAVALRSVLIAATGLAELHARGLLHRDVKPHNIALDGRGRAKLIDFDLVAEGEVVVQTRTGALGTFLFAAPELLKSGGRATPAADVYGLAVSAVFALSGSIDPDISRAPAAVVAELSAGRMVKAVLRRALDRRSEFRQRHAGAFAASLRGALRADDAAQSAAVLSGGTMIGARWRLRRKLRPRHPLADTWVAVDVQTTKSVALTLLHPVVGRGETTANSQYSPRIVPVDHPRLIRVLEPLTTDGDHQYVVSELLPAGHLGHWIRRAGDDHQQGLRLLVDIAEGVAALHARQFVHGALSHTAVRLDGVGRAKLGCVEMWVDARPPHTVGGALFDAPEVQGGHPPSMHSDVYGLGMLTAFVLLGGTMSVGLAEKSENVFARLEGLSAVKKVVLRAIDRSPDMRYPNAGAFRTALQTAMLNDQSMERRSEYEATPLLDAIINPIHSTSMESELGERQPHELRPSLPGSRLRPKLVYLPAGQFQMGPWEMTHEVRLRGDRWMAETPISAGQLHAVLGGRKPRQPVLPATGCSWYDAVDYCNTLSLAEGLQPAYVKSNRKVLIDPSANGFRLPTEAEWEYGCRAGTTSTFWSGDSDTDLTHVAWFQENSGGRPRPIGSLPANPWGFKDMHGNVREWCHDHMAPYPSVLQVNPLGPSGLRSRVLRGGSYRSRPEDCRSAQRDSCRPEHRRLDVGFRIVRQKVDADDSTRLS